MMKYIVKNGKIKIRTMENTLTDKALLLRWLTDPAVLACVYTEGEPWDMEKIDACFSDKIGENGDVVGCVIEYQGEAVGYVQYYPLAEDSYRFHEDVPFCKFAGGYGMDLFIGEPNLWGRGTGAKIIDLMAGYLISKLGATVVCADPERNNVRSIKAFCKAGFQPVGTMENYDDPQKISILMARYKGTQER